MEQKIAVRYMVFQGTEKGISGFKEYPNDSNCVKPNKKYINGTCHTKGDELDMLSLIVGFKTREEFKKEHEGENWLDNFSEELSKYVKVKLETDRIGWMVDEKLIEFYSPPGEFIPWPYSKYKQENISH